MDAIDAHHKANAALVKISGAAYVELPDTLDALLVDVIRGMRRPLSDPGKVAMFGLMRLKQDAHATRMLLGLGYPLQGMALAANMFELAYDLLYTRDDQARAESWINHRDLMQNVWQGIPIKKRMRDGLARVCAGPKEVEAVIATDYVTYGMLCGAKHGNPMLNRHTGGVVETGVLYLGPQDYSSSADRLNAAFAMHGVFKAAFIAALGAVQYHVEDILRAALEERVAQFNSDRKLAVDPLLPKPT